MTTSATADERAGGRRGARPARDGLGRRRRATDASTATSARGGHAARDAAPPAAARAARGPGPGRLDQPGRARTTSAARLTIPPAEAYGVASFYALFSLEPQPPVGGPRLRRHRLQGRAAPTSSCAELERSVGPAGAHRRQRPRDLAAEPVPRPVRRAPAALVTVAGEDAGRALASRRRRADGDRRRARRQAAGPPIACPTRSPQRRQRDAAAAAPRRRGRSRRASTTTARTAATRRCGAALELGPGRRDPRGHRRRSCSAAAAPRSRPAASGRRSRAAPARPHYLVCNADESEPGTFKDRVLMEDDPFAVDRGDDDRRRSPAAARRATSTSAASTRSPRERLAARDRPGARRAACSATTSWAAACASTSRSGAARAPTSAARRPRSSTRSRATAASRATSRRSRSRSACSASRRVVNNVETLVNVLRHPRRAAAARIAAHRHRHSTGTRLFCLSGCVERPGVYEVPYGTTLGDAARAGRRRRRRPRAAGGPARRRGRRVRRPPTSSTSPLTFEGTRAVGRDARLRRGHRVRRHRRPAGRSCCASPRSSATSRAASACPAASGRCGRRRRSQRLASGRPRGSADDELALLDEIGQAMRDASICGLGQTAAERDRVGDARSCELFAGSGARMSLPSAVIAEAHRRARPSTARPSACREGATILEALPRPRASRRPRCATSRTLTPGQRLPRLRGRGRGLAHAGAGLLAQGRGRAWWSRPTPSACATPQAGARAAGLVGRPLARRPTSTLDGEYGAEPERFGPPARRPRRASATTPAPGITTRRRPDGRDGRPAGQGRQRALRARLQQVHPLLQVRRGVRHRRAEHVRHRRRRARLRRAHLDRVRRAAARLGLRLLRQLHRRLPDRRADVQERVRHARRPAPGTRPARPSPTRSAPTAASAARSSCTCRTTRSSR